jgi:hypothetical protein
MLKVFLTADFNLCAVLQVLEANVALLGGLVTPIGAALTTEEVAASGANITFSGAKDQFWGFHVIHGDDPGSQYITYEVPTHSLSQVKVRMPAHEHMLD